MSAVAPWIHIILAYASFFVIAILASRLARRVGADMHDMQKRSASRMVLLGAGANLLALLVVLMLLIFLDGKPISALGLTFNARDAAASFGGLAATFLLAAGFVALLRRAGRLEQVKLVRPTAASGSAAGMGMTLTVLLVVVLQEEVLSRGYVTLNLIPYGAVVVVAASVTFFTVMHFLTNRVNRYQLVSWLVSAILLIVAYLLSGSIWVPIVLHYATDATNLLVFNITGQYSLVKTTPGLSEQQRSVFRVMYGVVITFILVAIYGPKFAFT